MSEYGLAIFIFALGAGTSLLLVGYIMRNYFRYKQEDNLAKEQ